MEVGWGLSIKLIQEKRGRAKEDGAKTSSRKVVKSVSREVQGNKVAPPRLVMKRLVVPVVGLKIISRGTMSMAAAGSEDAREPTSGSHELKVPRDSSIRVNSRVCYFL